MSRKVLIIPILPHLVKFLEKEYPRKDDHFIIRHKILPPKNLNPRRYQAYFKRPSDKMMFVKVLTNDSRLYKIYNWIQHIDNRFSEKMIDYVAARHGLQHDSVSLRNFLALYEITESEYGHDTAYKKWQRSAAYTLLKNGDRQTIG